MIRLCSEHKTFACSSRANSQTKRTSRRPRDARYCNTMCYTDYILNQKDMEYIALTTKEIYNDKVELDAIENALTNLRIVQMREATMTIENAINDFQSRKAELKATIGTNEWNIQVVLKRGYKALSSCL